MKKKTVLAAVLAVMTGFSLAGCRYDANYYVEEDDPYIASELGAVICYDNLGLGYVNAADTVYRLELTDDKKIDHVSVTAVNKNGESVSADSVAKFDEASGTLTAVGAGTVMLNVCDSKDKVLSSARVQVSPAYPEDPGTQYPLTAKDYTRGQNSLMGGLHDPSLIEIASDDGTSEYYIFSTGWDQGNDIHKSSDLLNWEYVGKPQIARSELEEIYAWLGTETTGYTPSWWAPDIVHASDGGYWLYTCVVDGHPGDTGVWQEIGGERVDYSMACIVLFHADEIDGRYTFEGVLMQSCIPAAGADLDVNAIDPQIITTPDGRMFMAYGSFGTGNYILELNPKTGLRKENYNSGKWLTLEEVIEQRENIVNEYNLYQNEYGEKIGWSSDYYGIGISRKNMEAPVIARHDVVIYDDNGQPAEEEKTYYYSMHSFDGLDVGYAMWGGRSEWVEGPYYGVNWHIVMNDGAINKTGNKYMGSFTWADKTSGIDVKLTGHNDLFTNSVGTNLAAYITRTDTYQKLGIASGTVFFSQVHQYTLNAKGDICINPNRYGGEVVRAITDEEFMHFAKDGQFKLVVLGTLGTGIAQSQYISLHEDGSITGAYTGTWDLYGDYFIKLTLEGGETNDTYYGTVMCTWLDDQDCVGMTFTALGRKTEKTIFANSVVG